MTKPRHDDAIAFPLLADPAHYRPCQWDLAADDERRSYWIGLFRSQFESLLQHAADVLADEGIHPGEPTKRARAEFTAYLDRVTEVPAAFGPLNVLTICQRREEVLRAHGIADPYRLIKQQENERAMRGLPGLLAQLDAMPHTERHTAIIEGVFAGNIFDMGAAETLKLYAAGNVDFATVRAKLKPRPWRFDALDAWHDRMADAANDSPYRAAVLFVDNAGPDVVLGMLPLAREMVKMGTTVVLTANTEPSLNDVTHDELTLLVAQAGESDPVIAAALADGALRLVASGNWAPLIDMKRVSPALAAEAAALPVDLVVLEGMGRSIESNFDSAFTCDVLRLAMIKDAGVAQAIDAEPFDLVMRFDPRSG
ncbi:ARMT1-like domain-containing protein [Phycisphaeraceae bacterium D3-23]